MRRILLLFCAMPFLSVAFPVPEQEESRCSTSCGSNSLYCFKTCFVKNVRGLNKCLKYCTEYMSVCDFICQQCDNCVVRAPQLAGMVNSNILGRPKSTKLEENSNRSYKRDAPVFI